MDGVPEPEDDAEGAEIETEGEPQELVHKNGESEGERHQSSEEVEIGGQREERGESEERYSESDNEEYGQRVTSRRSDPIISGSEGSGENHYAANEEDEVNHTRSPRSCSLLPPFC